MSRLKLIAAVVTVCTGCGEFSGTPREERARVVELTQAVLNVTPELHNLGRTLTHVGDLDGNGVGDVTMGGELVPWSRDATPEPEFPLWLLLLSDDPDAPIKEVRAMNVDAEARAAHPELRDSGGVAFRGFEPSASPQLGQLVGFDDQDRLLFARIDERGELLEVVAQQVRSVASGHLLESWKPSDPVAIPDRNEDGIPELLGVSQVESADGQRVSRLSLILPSASAGTAEVVALELPSSLTGYELDALQPVAYDAASRRLHVLAVIVPELPTDPNWGATGPRSLIAFELDRDGGVSEPVTIVSDLGALLGGGDGALAYFHFVETSLAALEGGGRLHLVADWWEYGPAKIDYPAFGGFDTLPPEFGHTFLGFNWDADVASARDFSTVASIGWRAPSVFFEDIVVEVRDASGVVRRTEQLLLSGLPGLPKGEPGLLAGISFEPAR